MLHDVSKDEKVILPAKHASLIEGLSLKILDFSHENTNTRRRKESMPM